MKNEALNKESLYKESLYNKSLYKKMQYIRSNYTLCTGAHDCAIGEEPVPEGQPAVNEVALREQLQKIREKLDRLGPINLAAIQEHQGHRRVADGGNRRSWHQ